MYKYVHGGDIYTEKTTATGKAFVDFSANINPLGVPAGVRAAIKQALSLCVNYPDAFCRELAAATAEFLQVEAKQLFFGNGAADVLFRLALALKPRQALLLAPTFADYEKALRSVDCEINLFNLSEEAGYKVTANILNSITPKLDIVVICNPNNPTGQLCDKELLLAILHKCHQCGTKLLVDECFMDFVDQDKAFSLRTLLKDYPELIILKAFTKTFAIPGVRLGYCMTNDMELHQRLHQCGQDWSVSILAQEAGKAAVKEVAYLERSFALIKKERAFLKKGLAALGAKVYDSQANYIFFQLEEPADLVQQLREQGYLIRPCSNYHNLGQHFYRIAVKNHTHNKGLLQAMKTVVKGGEAAESKKEC